MRGVFTLRAWLLQSHFWVLFLTVFTPLVLLFVLGVVFFQNARVTVQVSVTALPTSLKDTYLQVYPELQKEVHKVAEALDAVPEAQRYRLLDAMVESPLIDTVPLGQKDLDTLLWISEGQITWVSRGGAYRRGEVPASWKPHISQQASMLVPDGGRSVVLFRTSHGYFGLSGPNTPSGTGLVAFLHVVQDLFSSSWGVLVLVLLGTVAFGGIMAHWQSRKMVRPFEQIAAALQAYGAGKFEVRVQEQGPLELRQLVQSVNGIGAQLALSMDHLQKAHQQTRQVLERERRLLGNLSHDLRTPVAGLLVHVEELQRNPERLDFLPILEQEARSIARLVEDVLTLQQVQEKEKLQLEPVDLAALLSGLVQGMKTPAWTVGVSLQGRFEPDLHILADPGALERVVRNLITNGVQHTPEGGIVEVWTAGRENRVLLGVTDTGEGISAEHLPHVFERFYRAEASRTRLDPERRMGLGLAIAREITERMGGQISVESLPGEGTTFVLTFDRAEV